MPSARLCLVRGIDGRRQFGARCERGDGRVMYGSQCLVDILEATFEDGVHVVDIVVRDH